MNKEELRERLLSELYAGAFAGGFPAMLLDEGKVQSAFSDELLELAQRYVVK